MNEGQASPTSDNRGTPNKVLVYVTRETIMRILRSYENEIKNAHEEISPFIDQVMEGLAKEGQTETPSAFDHIFGKRNLFGRSFR